jgi:uncharacterized membrane-anchored protein YitT (DUF2179 family)
MKEETKERVISLSMLLVAIFLDAVTVTVFILPYDFPVTGITGIARIINHYSGLSISSSVAVLSAVMLLIGLIFIGKKFVAKTILASVAYPVFLAVMEKMDFSWFMMENRMLAGLFAGILTGITIGLCVRSGGSSGGTDIIGVALHHRLHIPVAIATYFLDFAVLMGQMLFGKFEDILYGVFILILTSIVMNRILTLGSNNVQMLIVSDKYSEIHHLIRDTTYVGVTLLHGKTGYLENEEEVLLCAVRPREVKHVRDIVDSIDPTAFIIMSNVSQVYGRGFSLEQLDL